MVRFPSVNHIFLTVESRWLTKYEEEELEFIYDCYAVEMAEQFQSVAILRSDV